MENRPLDTTNGNSSTHTHRIFSDTSTPRVVSSNSPTSQTVSKPPLQVSDRLDDSGEGNTPLQIKAVPTAERRNHGSAELQNDISKSFARSNGAYKRSRSNATNFTISNLFSRKLSKSVEEIVAGPRKEISATVLRANNLTHHNDVSFRYFALRMTHSKIFNRLMLFVILVNVLCIAFQNETPETHHLQKVLHILNIWGSCYHSSLTARGHSITPLASLTIEWNILITCIYSPSTPPSFLQASIPQLGKFGEKSRFKADPPGIFLVPHQLRFILDFGHTHLP